MASISPVVVDMPATSAAAEDTSIISRSGPGSSASDVPLVGGHSPSRSFSSASSTPLSGGRDPAATNATPVRTRCSRSGTPPRPHVHPPTATAVATTAMVAAAAAAAATTTTTEDVSKLDLAIMGCTMALLVPVALNIKDLVAGWQTPWRVAYGVVMMVSFVSTVTGFFTAWCPGVSWARRFSPSCARFGLVGAAAMFVVFVACKLGRFGCAAGVAPAALVVVVLLVVWVWSEQAQPTGQVIEPAAEEGASLPDDAP